MAKLLRFFQREEVSKRTMYKATQFPNGADSPQMDNIKIQNNEVRNNHDEFFRKDDLINSKQRLIFLSPEKKDELGIQEETKSQPNPRKTLLKRLSIYGIDETQTKTLWLILIIIFLDLFSVGLVYPMIPFYALQLVQFPTIYGVNIFIYYY